jgi:hypothetical protein
MLFPMRILLDPVVRFDQIKFPNAILESPLLAVSVTAPTTVLFTHQVFEFSD